METAENLSQTPKRTVGRRKAAEKSEKKWKEAMEEDQTFEALPDVFLGTCLGIPEIQREPNDTNRESQIPPPISTPPPILNTAIVTPSTAVSSNLVIPTTPIMSVATNPNPAMTVPSIPAVISPPIQASSVAPTPIEIPKINKPYMHNNIVDYKDNINMPKSNGLEHSCFTILEDSVLRDVVDHLACVTCCTKSLNTILSKNAKGRTEEIRVSCTNCNKVIFQRLIPQILPKTNSKHFHGSSHIENNSESLKRKAGDGDSNNVELLVCDVDVMKEDQAKEAEQDTFVSSPKNRGCIDLQRRKRKRTIISRVKKKEHIKPIRPCFFCSKMQSRLSRHVKTTHANQPYVQNMLRQPKEIQAKMMRQLRSEGIFAENQRRIKAGRYDLLRIRNQGSGELSACTYCRGYYKKKLLWRHRTTCIARPNNNSTLGQCNLMLPDQTQTKGNDEGLNGMYSEVEDNNNFNNSDIQELCQDKVGDKNITNGDVNSDPPEINRIKEILDGLEHGIFSQSVNPGQEVNGFFIKQEREDYVEEIHIPSGNNDYSTTSNQMGGVTMEDITPLPRNKESDNINEDQLLFDSLPAILSNSNLSSYGNPPLQAHYDPVKMKKNDYWNHDETYSDENYYYMWQDMTQLEAQHQELIPCNTLYQPNKKRKPRSEFQYQFWKKEDEDTILNYFTDMIKAMKVPGKDACREFLSKNPDIKTDWTRVKYKVYNQIQKQKKKMKKE